MLAISSESELLAALGRRVLRVQAAELIEYIICWKAEHMENAS